MDMVTTLTPITTMLATLATTTIQIVMTISLATIGGVGSSSSAASVSVLELAEHNLEDRLSRQLFHYCWLGTTTICSAVTNGVRITNDGWAAAYVWSCSTTATNVWSSASVSSINCRCPTTSRF